MPEGESGSRQGEGLVAPVLFCSGHRRRGYFFLAGWVLEVPPLRLGAAAMTFSFTFFGLRASLEPRDFSPIGRSFRKWSLILAQMLQAALMKSYRRTERRLSDVPPSVVEGAASSSLLPGRAGHLIMGVGAPVRRQRRAGFLQSLP
ncbi:hypothetical protein LA66_19050 [Aureimonas altamirensis]|uniref:Uncharacterized protein n=1 Tax=Aureimonas altamirensis TaxID=370622 RepID=A0A0B1Q2N9_9HYPH|nr:hypothetical protein LA66_19050 [Aureimonas altamirensis]